MNIENLRLLNPTLLWCDRLSLDYNLYDQFVKIVV